MLPYKDILSENLKPLFYDYFLLQSSSRIEVEDNDERWLKIVNTIFSANPNKYASFETNLDFILNEIEKYDCKDQYCINIVKIFRTLILLFLENEESNKVFLEIRIDLLKEDSIFISIYNLIRDYLSYKIDNKIPLSECCLILSRDSNDIEDHFYQRNLWKLKDQGLQVFRSQDSPDYLQYIFKYPIIFFIGHGGNGKDEGFAYYYAWEEFLRIKGDYLTYFPANRMLGFLSCAKEPYLNVLNKFDYFIIPNTSTTMYSEMFVKGFILAKKRGLDYETSIKWGLTALLLRSNEPLVYSVYKKGVILKYV